MSFSARLNRLLRLLPEGMGAREYVPPHKPYQLMADFYLVQFMQAPVGKRGQVLSQRAEELLRDLQYVERRLVPYLRQHLLEMAGYAIVRELRHVFDAALVIPRGPSGQVVDRGVILRDELGMSSKLVLRLRDSIGHPSTLLRRNTLQEQDYLEAARAGRVAFREGELFDWRAAYGGKLWQQACEAWLRLYAAHSLPEAIRYIDLLYSLQHNSGALLDKSPEYDGEWLRELLDLKFQAKEPEELLPYASSYLRQLVPQLMRALYGRSSGAVPVSHRLDPGYFAEVLQELQARLQELGFTPDTSSPPGHNHQLVMYWHGQMLLFIATDEYIKLRGEPYPVPLDKPDIVAQLVQRALQQVGLNR